MLDGVRLVEHAVVARDHRTAASARLAAHLAAGLERCCVGCISTSEVEGISRTSPHAYPDHDPRGRTAARERPLVGVPDIRAVYLKPMDIRARSGTDTDSGRGLGSIAEALAHSLLAWTAEPEDR